MNMDGESSEEEYEMAETRPKKYKPRINFSSLSFQEYIEKFRLRPSEVEFVLQKLGPDLQHKTEKNCALSPTQQILVTLRFLAVGCPYHGIADMHGMSKATVGRTMKRVIGLIVEKIAPTVIKWPVDASEIALEFFRKGGFPNVCGAGTIIKLQSPSVHEEQYVDRHGNHSLNAMMICGPDYTFYYVNSRFPGSVHDSRVLRASQISFKFEEGWRPFPQAVILGDSGYGLKSWLIPPLHSNPNDETENRFNVAHRRTRRLVENSFGILKNRFNCLRFLRVDPDLAANIVVTCVALHNIATKSDFMVEEAESEEVQDQQGQTETGNGDTAARARLNELLNFFRN